MKSSFSRVIAGVRSACVALLGFHALVLGACGNDSRASNDTKDAGSTLKPDASRGTDCTRESLKAAVDNYFKALKAHDPSRLPLAKTVKYTENGDIVDVGKGLWETAGALRFKRSALDTTTCNSITESAIAEGDSDIIFGLRLRLEAEKITEIETIIARDSSDYIFHSAEGLIGTADDDWETVLPSDQQPARKELAAIVNTYYALLPVGACGFADDCQRYENGVGLGTCRSSAICDGTAPDAGTESITPRLRILDVEAGIAVGVTLFPSILFEGSFADFHMFKYRDGKVHGLHALFSSAEQSGWD